MAASKLLQDCEEACDAPTRIHFFFLACHICKNARNVAQRNLVHKGRWANIACSFCCLSRKASKWLCECGIPWHTCIQHRREGFACAHKASRFSIGEQQRRKASRYDEPLLPPLGEEQLQGSAYYIKVVPKAESKQDQQDIFNQLPFILVAIGEESRRPPTVIKQRRTDSHAQSFGNMQPADDDTYFRSNARRCAGKAEASITAGQYSSSSKGNREAREDDLSDPKRRKCINLSSFDPLTMHKDSEQEGETLATQGQPDLQGRNSKRDSTHIEYDWSAALGTSNRLFKYLKQSKKLPEAHHFLSRSDVETSVTHEIEGETFPNQTQDGTGSEMGTASASKNIMSKKTKDGANSDLSRAILSSLCVQHTVSDYKRDHVPQQEAPNRCSLMKEGGKTRQKRYSKPQAKLEQPKPSVGVAAKLRRFQEPRPPEGKGRD